jgi:Bacterial PH domain
MPFTASYDRLTKFLSAFVCLGLLGLGVATHSLAIGILALLVILAAYAYSPRSYSLEGRTIVVRRLAGQVSIPLDDVREARRTTAGDSRGCIRLWGSGGLFGYYGLFSSSQLGKFTQYVTNRKNSVIVITGTGKTVFSPDDVDGFLAAIRVSNPAPGSTPASSPAFDAPRSRALGTIIGIAVGLAAIGIAVAAATYSPGPPGYTLTPAALTIHDRFYPVTLQSDAVEVRQIRLVDVATDPAWRPTRRTNGFANSHYQSGWFRVANGQKVRLYRAGSGQAVLLPPKTGGTAVLYQAANPEEFMNQIRASWNPAAGSDVR